MRLKNISLIEYFQLQVPRGGVLPVEAWSVLEALDDIDRLKAVHLDNTNINNEYKAGCVTALAKLDRKWHAIDCSFYQHELPSSAFQKEYADITQSPIAFSGPLDELYESDSWD